MSPHHPLPFYPQFPSDEEAEVELDISDEALAAKNEKVRGAGRWGAAAAAVPCCSALACLACINLLSQPPTPSRTHPHPTSSCLQCGGRLARSFRGPAHEVFAKVLRGLSGTKLTKPGTFRDAEGTGHAVRCSYKVGGCVEQEGSGGRGARRWGDAVRCSY